MSTFGHLIGKPVADARAALIHYGYATELTQPDSELWEKNSVGELFHLHVQDGVVVAFSRWTEKPALTIDPVARRKR